MSRHTHSNDAQDTAHQPAKDAVAPRKNPGPEFSPGENAPLLDADMRPLGDPSRLAEAADVAPGDEAE